MRRRSLTGPILLLIIGGLFLWRNFNPEIPVFNILAQYWPFLLILWGLIRLVEVVWPGNEPRWRGSFTGGEVVLIVFICLIGSGFWAGYRHGFRWTGGSLDVFGQEYDYPVSAKSPAEGITRVVFDNARGSIKVTGADTNEVSLEGHKAIRAFGRTDADRTNGNTPVEMVREGDHLLIRSNQDRAPENQRVTDDLEVTLPKGLAVEARGRRSDYEISDVNGDVELFGDRGDVRLARVGGSARLEMGRSETIRAVDVKGRVDVQGQGSDIYLENIGGEVSINGAYSGSIDFRNLAKPVQFEGARNTELRVEGVPGQITMNLSEFSGTGIAGPVRLVTGSRDVRLSQFTKALTLETERGNIELEVGLPVPTIEARSGSGNIELVLPDKAAFQLDATAQRGEASNDYGPQFLKETEGHVSTLKGRTGEGPTIRIMANRGSVEVRKTGTPSSMPDMPGPPPNPPKPPKAPKDLKDTEIKL